MRVILKAGVLVLAPETPEETAALADWRAASRGHVFHLPAEPARGAALRDLGLREEACREPINVVFDQCDTAWRPISNLAHTPFDLDGRRYASVEGFWQGLKIEDATQRADVAKLWGVEAKRAVQGMQPETIAYDGHFLAAGGPDHRALMSRACRAKFGQDSGARDALLATGERPLTHRVPRDSTTIPGVLMADIWMRLRERLRRDGTLEDGPPMEDGRILYFARDRERFGFLSHFEPSPILMDGVVWPTVEHFYQAQKSDDPAYVAAIRSAPTPGRAKQLSAAPDPKRAGVQHSWFASEGREPRPDWARVKLDLMRRADLAKFTQNPILRARLLATGDAELIEDSPYDAFWGSGPDGYGLNWAGRVLTEVRKAIRAED